MSLFNGDEDGWKFHNCPFQPFSQDEHKSHSIRLKTCCVIIDTPSNLEKRLFTLLFPTFSRNVQKQKTWQRNNCQSNKALFSNKGNVTLMTVTLMTNCTYFVSYIVAHANADEIVLQLSNLLLHRIQKHNTFQKDKCHTGYMICCLMTSLHKRCHLNRIQFC